MMPLAATVAENSSKILLWSGVLIGLLIVLSLGVWYYRRHWLADDDTSSQSWTLEDIRRLRDQGALTPAEYEALRGTIIGSLKGGSSGYKMSGDGSPDPVNGSGLADDDFDLEKGSRP